VASRGGVLVNDQVLAVNRYVIGSLADLRLARQRSQVKKNVLLLLQRDQAKMYVALPVEE
jgi:hypothetical protein